LSQRLVDDIVEAFDRLAGKQDIELLFGVQGKAAFSASVGAGG
jgi:hypothetical protein